MIIAQSGREAQISNHNNILVPICYQNRCIKLKEYTKKLSQKISSSPHQVTWLRRKLNVAKCWTCFAWIEAVHICQRTSRLQIMSNSKYWHITLILWSTLIVSRRSQTRAKKATALSARDTQEAPPSREAWRRVQIPKCTRPEWSPHCRTSTQSQAIAALRTPTWSKIIISLKVLFASLNLKSLLYDLQWRMTRQAALFRHE